MSSSTLISPDPAIIAESHSLAADAYSKGVQQGKLSVQDLDEVEYDRSAEWHSIMVGTRHILRNCCVKEDEKLVFPSSFSYLRALAKGDDLAWNLERYAFDLVNRFFLQEKATEGRG